MGAMETSPAPRSDSSAAATKKRPSLLASITGPADVKCLASRQLEELAAELRDFLIDSVTQTGGHLGAGLGVVELTVALFAELDLDGGDRLVWDVGHQCYPHKLLTGRAGRFAKLRQYGGLSGYPDPAESAYDLVKTGHGGTSISTATGFALAQRLAQAAPVPAPERPHTAVAVIGDGALQEGNAYEALNHAGSLGELDLIVILNDNGMAISPSTGALRDTFRRAGGARDFVQSFGLEYIGPVDGHDVEAVRLALRRARAGRRPTVIHALTIKGHGYRPAEPEHTCYHAVSAPRRAPADPRQEDGPSFTAAFARHAISMAARDPRVVAVTAAMLEGTGLAAFQQRFPDRCIDVGMAEQHAVALSAGLALAGYRPICAIYSTFLQRAYDQLFQEVALQRARVLFVLDRGGLVGSDGATHNGVFDIGYLRALPHFAVLAPRDAGELAHMMELAHTWDGPVAIRIPRGSGPRAEAELPHANLPIGRAQRIADGDDGCLLALGPMVYTAMEVRERVRALTGAHLAVVDARSAKPLDEFLLRQELAHQPVVFTLEDHMLASGFGSAVAEAALTRGRVGVEVNRLCLLGLPDRFIDHGERAEQLAEGRLDAETLTRRILPRLSETRRPKAS